MFTLRPTTSDSAYPKSRSAAGLKASMRPWSSMTTIPSTADCTIERHRAASLAAEGSLSGMGNFYGGVSLQRPLQAGLRTRVVAHILHGIISRMTADLTTTNVLLGILAAVSLLEALV